ANACYSQFAVQWNRPPAITRYAVQHTGFEQDIARFQQKTHATILLLPSHELGVGGYQSAIVLLPRSVQIQWSCLRCIPMTYAMKHRIGKDWRRFAHRRVSENLDHIANVNPRVLPG